MSPLLSRSSPALLSIPYQLIVVVAALLTVVSPIRKSVLFFPLKMMESKLSQRTNHQSKKSKVGSSEAENNGEDETESENSLPHICIDVPLICKKPSTTMSFSAISPINEQEQQNESVLQVN